MIYSTKIRKVKWCTEMILSNLNLSNYLWIMGIPSLQFDGSFTNDLTEKFLP